MVDFAPSPPGDSARRRWLRWVGAGVGLLSIVPLAVQAGVRKDRKPVRATAAPARKALGTRRAPGARATAALAPAAEPALAGTAVPAQPRWRDAGLPLALAERLGATGLPVEAFGLYAAPIEEGTPLLSLNAERPYVLASTAKVVTSLAGLNLLGADYRWRTRAYLQGALREGTLHGDLLIVGGGDARLDSEDLLAWFERMQRSGLRRITGNILLDRSAFQLTEADHQRTPEPGLHRPHHVRPDALSVDGGVLRVSVQASAGREPEVVLQPPLHELRLVNTVQARGGCTAHAQVSSGAVERLLQVGGSWAPGCGVRRIELAPMSSEELSVLGVGALWQAVGGLLDGQVLDRSPGARGAGAAADARGRAPTPWSMHTSAPLLDFIQVMNKSSHNVMARHLMLSIAPGFPRRPATLAAARTRMDDWLRQQGLAADDVAMDNGSGLSRGERGKPQALGHLLRRALLMPDSKGFLQSLPVAGVDGTLSTRLQRSAAQGQAYLKTGSLTDVRALAGYVRGASGRWQVFTAFVNHPGAPRATQALDECVDWVARHA